MHGIIDEWRQFAEQREEENFFYVRSLKFKDSEKVDSLARRMHQEAFDKIDCLQCGNCCKVSKPILNKSDVKRIADFLGISSEQVIADYLEKDGDESWKPNVLPCPFLDKEDNVCSIYAARPMDCQEFPHTNKKRFASRSYGHSANTTICPAAYFIVENMKRRIR